MTKDIPTSSSGHHDSSILQKGLLVAHNIHLGMEVVNQIPGASRKIIKVSEAVSSTLHAASKNQHVLTASGAKTLSKIAKVPEKGFEFMIGKNTHAAFTQIGRGILAAEWTAEVAPKIFFVNDDRSYRERIYDQRYELAEITAEALLEYKIIESSIALSPYAPLLSMYASGAMLATNFVDNCLGKVGKKFVVHQGGKLASQAGSLFHEVGEWRVWKEWAEYDQWLEEVDTAGSNKTFEYGSKAFSTAYSLFVGDKQTEIKLPNKYYSAEITPELVEGLMRQYDWNHSLFKEDAYYKKSPVKANNFFSPYGTIATPELIESLRQNRLNNKGTIPNTSEIVNAISSMLIGGDMEAMAPIWGGHISDAALPSFAEAVATFYQEKKKALLDRNSEVSIYSLEDSTSINQKQQAVNAELFGFELGGFLLNHFIAPYIYKGNFSRQTKLSVALGERALNFMPYYESLRRFGNPLQHLSGMDRMNLAGNAVSNLLDIPSLIDLAAQLAGNENGTLTHQQRENLSLARNSVTILQEGHNFWHGNINAVTASAKILPALIDGYENIARQNNILLPELPAYHFGKGAIKSFAGKYALREGVRSLAGKAIEYQLAQQLAAKLGETVIAGASVVGTVVLVAKGLYDTVNLAESSQLHTALYTGSVKIKRDISFDNANDLIDSGRNLLKKAIKTLDNSRGGTWANCKSAAGDFISAQRFLNEVNQQMSALDKKTSGKKFDLIKKKLATFASEYEKSINHFSFPYRKNDFSKTFLHQFSNAKIKGIKNINIRAAVEIYTKSIASAMPDNDVVRYIITTASLNEIDKSKVTVQAFDFLLRCQHPKVYQVLINREIRKLSKLFNRSFSRLKVEGDYKKSIAALHQCEHIINAISKLEPLKFVKQSSFKPKAFKAKIASFKKRKVEMVEYIKQLILSNKIPNAGIRKSLGKNYKAKLDLIETNMPDLLLEAVTNAAALTRYHPDLERQFDTQLFYNAGKALQDHLKAKGKLSAAIDLAKKQKVLAVTPDNKRHADFYISYLSSKKHVENRNYTEALQSNQQAIIDAPSEAIKLNVQAERVEMLCLSDDLAGAMRAGDELLGNAAVSDELKTEISNQLFSAAIERLQKTGDDALLKEIEVLNEIQKKYSKTIDQQVYVTNLLHAKNQISLASGNMVEIINSDTAKHDTKIAYSFFLMQSSENYKLAMRGFDYAYSHFSTTGNITGCFEIAKAFTCKFMFDQNAQAIASERLSNALQLQVDYTDQVQCQAKHALMDVGGYFYLAPYALKLVGHFNSTLQLALPHMRFSNNPKVDQQIKSGLNLLATGISSATPLLNSYLLKNNVLESWKLLSPQQKMSRVYHQALYALPSISQFIFNKEIVPRVVLDGLALSSQAYSAYTNLLPVSKLMAGLEKLSPFEKVNGVFNSASSLLGAARLPLDVYSFYHRHRYGEAIDGLRFNQASAGLTVAGLVCSFNGTVASSSIIPDEVKKVCYAGSSIAGVFGAAKLAKAQRKSALQSNLQIAIK